VRLGIGTRMQKKGYNWCHFVLYRNSCKAVKKTVAIPILFGMLHGFGFKKKKIEIERGDTFEFK
jgi:hypothetical protein